MSVPMLETKCVGDNFGMLMTDLRCWLSILYTENQQHSVVIKIAVMLVTITLPGTMF